MIKWKNTFIDYFDRNCYNRVIDRTEFVLWKKIINNRKGDNFQDNDKNYIMRICLIPEQE